MVVVGSIGKVRRNQQGTLGGDDAGDHVLNLAVLDGTTVDAGHHLVVESLGIVVSFLRGGVVSIVHDIVQLGQSALNALVVGNALAGVVNSEVDVLVGFEQSVDVLSSIDLVDAVAHCLGSFLRHGVALVEDVGSALCFLGSHFLHGLEVVTNVGELEVVPDDPGVCRQVFSQDTQLGGLAEAQEVNRHIPVVGVVEQVVGSPHTVRGKHAVEVRIVAVTVRRVAVLIPLLLRVQAVEDVVELILRIACIEESEHIGVATEPLLVSSLVVVATIPALGLQAVSTLAHEADFLPNVDALAIGAVAVPLLNHARGTGVVLEAAIAVDGPAREAGVAVGVDEVRVDQTVGQLGARLHVHDHPHVERVLASLLISIRQSFQLGIGLGNLTFEQSVHFLPKSSERTILVVVLAAIPRLIVEEVDQLVEQGDVLAEVGHGSLSLLGHCEALVLRHGLLVVDVHDGSNGVEIALRVVLVDHEVLIAIGLPERVGTVVGLGGTEVLSLEAAPYGPVVAGGVVGSQADGDVAGFLLLEHEDVHAVAVVEPGVTLREAVDLVAANGSDFHRGFAELQHGVHVGAGVGLSLQTIQTGRHVGQCLLDVGRAADAPVLPAVVLVGRISAGGPAIHGLREAAVAVDDVQRGGVLVGGKVPQSFVYLFSQFFIIAVYFFCCSSIAVIKFFGFSCAKATFFCFFSSFTKIHLSKIDKSLVFSYKFPLANSFITSIVNIPRKNEILIVSNDTKYFSYNVFTAFIC